MLISGVVLRYDYFTVCEGAEHGVTCLDGTTVNSPLHYVNSWHTNSTVQIEHIIQNILQNLKDHKQTYTLYSHIKSIT